MKILTVVGARPNFIKAAPVSHQLMQWGIEEILVHTGQHYDDKMSAHFFDELGLPLPDYNLEIGSGSHGMQTGRMLEALEATMGREKPDWVLVYGDTNSTLAGALAAAKLHIPLAHVEAGIRSYNRAMPEEMNRRLTDHISTVLLCPTQQAVENLAAEGFNNLCNDGELTAFEDFEACVTTEFLAVQNRFESKGAPGVFNTGDVMFDMLVKAAPRLDSVWQRVKDKYRISEAEYILSTIHRPENTDAKAHLENIVKGLGALPVKVIWPLHPRTEKLLTGYNLYPDIHRAKNIILTEPIGYTAMLSLINNAQCVITDSGGIQKEAYMLGVPCLTCRNDTEWPQTVNSGWNKLIGLGAAHLEKFFPFGPLPQQRPNWFGDGRAAKRIVKVLNQFLESKRSLVNDRGQEFV